MYILTIRTDKPEAEIGLFEDDVELSYQIWPAHRQLAETIHLRIRDSLTENDLKLTDVSAIAVFQGPGSFTGLRIGIAVANALASSLEVPIVATTGDDWRELAIGRIVKGENDTSVTPEYGSLPNITAPRK